MVLGSPGQPSAPGRWENQEGRGHTERTHILVAHASENNMNLACHFPKQVLLQYLIKVCNNRLWYHITSAPILTIPGKTRPKLPIALQMEFYRLMSYPSSVLEEEMPLIKPLIS